ncbi:PEP-CTERM sorting domain-containing protein [Gemmatimonas sp.]|jgi:hypothetical protein|uniref:PEP-CTERM sorting domain-containing protein n=1 Tax=Gemmatimonas sp. TaxID=1962908 RepID=UPI0037BF0922
MTFRTSLKPTTMRAAAVALGLALSEGQASAQSSTNFESLGYGGASTACQWSGASSMIGAHNGFTFYGLRALDQANYQRCWDESETKTQQNFYEKTGVVALASDQAMVQSNGSSFVLQSLRIGSGWTTPITITMRAGSLAGGQFFTKDWSLGGPLQLLDGLPTQAIDYFWLDVDWNLPTTESGMASYDPFNSRALNAATGATDGKPYLTYFVDHMEVTVSVPEPTSFALVGSGLLGLMGVARRRRQGSR